MENRTERLNSIRSAYDSLHKASNTGFITEHNLLEIFMTEFCNEINKLYEVVPGEHTKEDIKILINDLYATKDERFKKFLIEVINCLLKLI